MDSTWNKPYRLRRQRFILLQNFGYFFPGSGSGVELAPTQLPFVHLLEVVAEL